jgi:hypothetical protein
MSESVETHPAVEVTGVVRLADGSTSEFSIRRDGAWTQWGAGAERLGQSRDAVDAMSAALIEEDLIETSDMEEEEGS